MRAKKVLNDVDFGEVRGLFEESGRKILVYHRDADGVCSAAILMKFFPDFEGIPREGPVMDRKFLGEIISMKPKVLVFMDIPADQEWEKLLELRKEVPDIRIVIIDHHTVEKDMNKEKNFVHINPRFIDKKNYIPASCVIYKIVEKLDRDPRSFMWVSLTGIIGDYGMKDCDWMFKEYAKTSKTRFSELSRTSDTISSAITLKGLEGAKIALRAVLKSESYRDLVESPDLKRWNRIVQAEIKRIVDDFGRTKEVFGDKKVIFYRITSPMNITSVIATITAEKHPDHIVIIWKESEGFYKISLRYQAGKLSVGDLAKYATKGIGSGGGHIKSAGAYTNNWKEFRKRVFEYMK